MSRLQVTVADYGVGNLLSVRRALEHCGASVRMSNDPRDVEHAERLVLPGVGAFGDCMNELRRFGMVDAVLRFAERGRPFLGICVGMQILLDRGDEYGEHAGLGLVPGTVTALPATDADGHPHKVPHIGWTPLELPHGAAPDLWRDSLLRDTAPGTTVYFVHSYTAVPADPAHRLADAHYNGRLLSAAVRRDHVTGTQFHPEKSGPAGLALVSAFLST